MAVYFVNPTEELELFVEWVLGDLTERHASGKRPKQAMTGFWMTRPNLPGRRRLSDLTERRYVALSVLIQAGRSMDDALLVLSRHLGRATFEEREVLRTAYYDFKTSGIPVSLNEWRGYFYSWAEWVLTAGPAELKRVSVDYIRIGKQNKAAWFSDFMRRLRKAVTLTQWARVLETAPAPVTPPSQ